LRGNYCKKHTYVNNVYSICNEALAYEDKETPKTGDATTMMPWLAVMAAAAVGAVAFKKREN